MKTGLFFGSFNPIHIGHMAIANYMVEFTDIEQVWFVVSPHNPLKEKHTLLPDHHRIEMVRIAINDDWRYKASDIEFKLSKPSYTIDTLAYLNEKFPNNKFALIMGSDNLNTLNLWKNYREILKHHIIYVYPRPGYPADISQFNPDNEITADIRLTEAPLMDISSKFIRKAIKSGKDIRYYLSEKVFSYILEMHFYKK